MAKNRSKKKNGSTAMAIESSFTANNSISQESQGRNSLSLSLCAYAY